MNAYTLAAIPPTLLLIAEPTLWVYTLLIAAFVALAAVAAAAHRFRGERDAAWAEIERRDREAAAPAATPLSRKGKGVLRAVPTQRSGSDHLADDDDWFARLYDDKGNLR
jgi:hypothetical protein